MIFTVTSKNAWLLYGCSPNSGTFKARELFALLCGGSQLCVGFNPLSAGAEDFLH